VEYLGTTSFAAVEQIQDPGVFFFTILMLCLVIHSFLHQQINVSERQKAHPAQLHTGIRTAASARLVAELVRRIVPPARAAVALAVVSGDLRIRLANGEATVDAIEDNDEEDDARDTLLTELSSAAGKAAVLLYLLIVGIV